MCGLGLRSRFGLSFPKRTEASTNIASSTSSGEPPRRCAACSTVSMKARADARRCRLARDARSCPDLLIDDLPPQLGVEPRYSRPAMAAAEDVQRGLSEGVWVPGCGLAGY
jgi:hypothetical protein